MNNKENVLIMIDELWVAAKHPVQLPYSHIRKVSFDDRGDYYMTDACVCVVSHSDLIEVLEYIKQLQEVSSDLYTQNQVLIKEIAETVRRI